MADANPAKQVVARFFETFSSGDVAAILDALDDGAVWWVSGRIEGMSGSYDKASFGPLLLGAKAAYRGAGLTITPTAMIAEGDKVAVEAEGFAELTDGRAFTPHYHFLITVRGDKLLEVKEYMDTQHAKEIFFGG
jgi:ketosteroid isomerase-like protein